MTNAKAKIILSLYALVLCVLVFALIYRAFAYDLGLKKPAFKKGDCIVWLDGEFGKVISKRLIIRVGKTDYQEVSIYGNHIDDMSSADSERFMYVDDRYVKTECNLSGELNQ